MEIYGDEDYIYYLSNLLLLEKERDIIYIGDETVNIHDREAFNKAVVKCLNEVIEDDK